MKTLKIACFISVFLAGSFFSVCAAEDTVPLTLKQAVEKALEYYPSIRAERMAFKAQVKSADAAWSGLLPSLDFSMDAGYEDVHNTLTRNRQSSGLDDDNHRGMWFHSQTLTLSQLLWDGFRTKNLYNAQNAKLESQRVMVDASAEHVSMQVIEIYLDIIQLRKIIRLAEDNIEQLKALRQKTRMRLEKGKGTVTDVDRVQLTLSDAKAVLINYQGLFEAAKDRFAAMTGVNAALITRQVNMPKMSLGSVEQAVKLAMKKNTGLKAADSHIQERTADLKATKALYHPKVSLIAKATRDENVDGLDDTDHSVAGLVRINYNLFNSGGDRSQIYKNANLLAEARLRKEELSLKIRTQVKNEFTRMTTAKRQIPLLKQKVEQNIKVLASYNEQFLVGKRDIMDVIDAQKMLFTFQAAQETMETRKKLAEFRLLMLTGQLFTILDIPFNSTP